MTIMSSLNIHNNFIQKSISKFGDRFVYISKYVSCHKLMEFKCKSHDIKFTVSGRNHLRSNSGSCPECKKIELINSKKYEEEYFIKKSMEIFGNNFDYSKTKYINKYESLILICKVHNYQFKIKPKGHYYSKGGGCNKCCNIIKNKESIKQFEEKHFGKFSFSNFNYDFTPNTLQKIKCNSCSNVIKINILKFDGKCDKCIKIMKKNILDIGFKIIKVIRMRLDFEKDEYIKRIKLSGNEEYFISNYGKIYDKDKNRLFGHTNKQGYIFVRLINNCNTSLYRVHRLVCSTFNGSSDKKYVDHINRVRNDNRAENLRWVSHSENMKNRTSNKISKPIEYFYENREKEKFIELNETPYGLVSNYLISNYGKIYNTNTNKYVKLTLTDEGYLVTRLQINNKYCSVSIHRLVCFTFNGKKEKYNVVNHINEIKHDNYYKNLEWVNVKQNNRHSKNISVNMLDDNKNIIKTFSSYTEAHKYFGLKHAGCISSQTKKGKKAYGYYWSINKTSNKRDI